MARVSSERLREILAGCSGVTPGPWTAYHDHLRPGMSGYINEVQSGTRRAPIVQWTGFDNSCRSQKEHAKNARHIARLDPETVASIIEELLAHRDTGAPHA